jgi:predicted dehydrogenase
MKQIVQNLRTGVLKVEEVPAGMSLDGRVLVANRASLISSGTERSTVQAARQNLVEKARSRPDLVRKVIDTARREGLLRTLETVLDRLDKPAALGYSSAGVVIEVGRGVPRIRVGDRVACAGQGYASHAEIISVPHQLCVPIPESVEFEDAAFVTLGAIALQGVRQAEAKLGETVAVIGLGLIGQLTIQLLKASGCQVIGADLDAAKLELATRLGVDAATYPDALPESVSLLTQGHGVDAVLITAGTKSNGPVELAGTVTRQKGRVIVVGAVGLTIPREPYYRKELDLRMSMSYGPGRYDPRYEEEGRDYPYAYVRWTEQRNMQAFLSLIREGKVTVRPLITHRFSIEEATTAYDELAADSGTALGIVLTYPIRDLRVEARLVTLPPAQPVRPVEAVQIGVIGAGQHVRDRLLPALSGLKQAGIRAICTTTGVQARAVAEKWKAQYCTTDYREILTDPHVNAVLIGTRHHLHADLVVDALRAGKHVFVEKPLCLSGEELARIRAAYGETAGSGLILMVGFNRRFSSHAAKAREFFGQVRGPLVISYRVNAGMLSHDHWVHDPLVGGGRLLGEVCHFVDYCQWLCGSMPVSVFARQAGGSRTASPEDQFLLTLSFEDGSIASILYSGSGDIALSKERVEVLGNGKSLTMDDYVETIFYAGGVRKSFRSRRQDKGFEGEMSSFVRALLRGGEPPIAWTELESVTRTCLAAAGSLREGIARNITEAE